MPNKFSFSWVNKKLEPRHTDKYNTGTFTKANIKKGEKLIIQGGYVVPLKAEAELPKEFNDNGIQITEDLVLSVCEKEKIGGINYVNHSCDANAGFHGQIFIVAMRDIKKGEEITSDYRENSLVLFKCNCGTRNCQGIMNKKVAN